MILNTLICIDWLKYSRELDEVGHFTDMFHRGVKCAKHDN